MQKRLVDLLSLEVLLLLMVLLGLVDLLGLRKIKLFMKYDFNQKIWIQDMGRKLTSLMIWTLRIAKSIFSIYMNSSWRIVSSWAPSPNSNLKAHIWTTWFQKNVLINFKCSSKHNFISENSDTYLSMSHLETGMEIHMVDLVFDYQK